MNGKKELKQKSENRLFAAKTAGLATIALGAISTYLTHDFAQEYGYISPDILATSLGSIMPVLTATIYSTISGLKLKKEYELANRPLARPVISEQPTTHTTTYALNDSSIPLETLLE